jgi:hypothetical protein
VASRNQGSLAIDIIARQVLRQIEQQNGDEMSGSSDLPAYANGRIPYATSRIQDRNALGTCLAKGNNGASSGFCKASRDDIRNADTQLSTLTTSWLLDTSDDAKPFSAGLVKRFLDNLFADKVFEPLPARLTALSPMPNEVQEIEADKLSYIAALTTFQRPFFSEQADRLPLKSAPKSLEFLQKTIERAGYDGDVKKQLIDGQKISKAAEEYIRFRVAELDPAGDIDLAKEVGGSKTDSLLTYVILKLKGSIALQYDIREQLKQTNMLLGAIGNILAAPEYQDIRGRIQAVSAGSEGAAQ